VEGIRLVAIAEPVAGAAPAGGAGPGSVLGADVLGRVMASRLDPRGPSVRWGIGAGDDAASAAAHARIALRRARERGTWLGFATGDEWREALLADLGLALAALLDDLTPRQAQIAGLILVDGARQAEVAVTLGVSRATVSVTVARGRLPAIAGALRAIEALMVGPPAPGAGHDGCREADGNVPSTAAQ
jgi:hypothetical protein